MQIKPKCSTPKHIVTTYSPSCATYSEASCATFNPPQDHYIHTILLEESYKHPRHKYWSSSTSYSRYPADCIQHFLRNLHRIPRDDREDTPTHAVADYSQAQYILFIQATLSATSAGLLLTGLTRSPDQRPGASNKKGDSITARKGRRRALRHGRRYSSLEAARFDGPGAHVGDAV